MFPRTGKGLEEEESEWDLAGRGKREGEGLHKSGGGQSVSSK